MMIRKNCKVPQGTKRTNKKTTGRLAKLNKLLIDVSN